MQSPSGGPGWWPPFCPLLWHVLSLAGGVFTHKAALLGLKEVQLGEWASKAAEQGLPWDR